MQFIWQQALNPQDVRAVLSLQTKVEETLSVHHKLDLDFAEQKSYAKHLLCWQGKQLLGYVWATSFDGVELEATMIVPAEQAVFDGLFGSIKEYAQTGGFSETLFIADTVHSFLWDNLEAAGCARHFSEYYMSLSTEPLAPPVERALPLVKPKQEDVPQLVQLLGGQPLEEDLERTLVYKEGNQLVACARLDESQGLWGIYGFVVDQSRRGQGMGRKVFESLLHLIQEQQPAGIYLEVETENLPAFQLYRSEGFQVRNQYDYYLMK